MATITASDVSNLAKETKWLNALRVEAMMNTFFGPALRGQPGSGKPIVVHSDATVAAGGTVKVPLIGNLDGEGQTNESTLSGNEETIDNDSQSVVSNLIRHGVKTTKIAQWKTTLDLMAHAKTSLGTWYGRKQDRLIFTAILAVSARLYGGDATGLADMDAADTFGTAEARRIKLALMRKGAQPLRVELDGHGNAVPYYGVLISVPDEANLTADTVWQTAHREAGDRAASNPLFSGALGTWGGLIFFPHREIAGAGSALRPEAVVASDIDDTVTTVPVGAGKTGVDYTKWFDTAGTLLIGSEQITYTGKTVGSFTGCTRGAASTSAAAHTASDLVTQNNVTRQIGFGAEAVAQGVAREAGYIVESADYGMVSGIGVEAIDGYAVVQDIAGNAANLVVMESYAATPV